MERGGSLYYYHRDGLGSVSEISNESGNLVERYEYDVYGNPQIFDSSDTQLNASAIGNPYLFTGRRYDPESGNYYYRARIYSPELGRFLQTDPLGYVDGLNLYAYVGNNPASWIDPYGEDPISLATLALLGLAGGAIGIATTEPGQDAFEALTEHLIHAVETFPENAANVYRQVKDLFAPPEEIPPLPGTPANTEPIDTTEQLIPPDMSTFWGPLITPDDGVCYPEPEIFPGHGDDPLLDPVIADPITEPVAPPIYASKGNQEVKLTNGGQKVLRDPKLKALKDNTVAEAIRARGGGASQANQVASNLKNKTLAEVANMAAQGDPAAETAIKMVKQASGKAQKYGGK